MHALCECLKNNTIEEEQDADTVQAICTITYNRIMPTLLSIAVATNVLNSTVLYRLHKCTPPTAARIYLLWLAVTHCLTCWPIIVGISTRNRFSVAYGWAYYFAHFEEPLYNSLNCTCVYIIVGLSYDRFAAVCNAHSYYYTYRYEQAKGIVFLSYVVPCILYIPQGFSQNVIQSGEGWTMTESNVFNMTPWKAWAVSLQFWHRIIPSIALIVLNTKILQQVIKLQSLRAATKCPSNYRTQRDKQLIQMLLALTGTFLLTNIPSAVMPIIHSVSNEYCVVDRIGEAARSAANCLEMAGYCFDFLFYFLMNTEYRKELSLLMNDIKHCYYNSSALNSSCKKEENVIATEV